MGYPKAHARERIQRPYVSTVEELAYIIDVLAEEMLHKLCGYDWARLDDAHLAQIDGTLGMAQFEFRRRVATAFYEGRLAERGDVFEFPHPEVWDLGPEPEVPTDDKIGVIAMLSDLAERQRKVG